MQIRDSAFIGASVSANHNSNSATCSQGCDPRQTVRVLCVLNELLVPPAADAPPQVEPLALVS